MIINHDKLGIVKISVDRRVTRIRASWKDDSVIVQAPQPPTEQQARKFLDRFCDDILRIRPKKELQPGTSLIVPGVEFRIKCSNSVAQGRVVAYPNLPVTEVCLGPWVDPNSPEGTRAINRVIKKSAHALAERLLLPRAKELAAAVGAQPTAWKIGRGARVLGTCNAMGVITLSSRNIFLTQELRDYIVFHELAHLLEMNHSARFHAVCDRYCGGREKELIAKLRKFKFPII